MPIVGNGNNVHIEYEIPSNIKEIITYDFLKEFRNQMLRVHSYYGLNSFAEEGMTTNTSTTGWYTAFWKACMLTGKEELINYNKSLPWYDSDIFEYEITKMLVDNHLILGELSKIISKQLNINEDDLRVCSECGNWYTKDMGFESIDNSNELEFICFACNDTKNTKDGNENATDYYRSILKEIEEYNKRL